MLRNQTGLTMAWNYHAFVQYTEWYRVGRRYARRINRLIKSIIRDGYQKGLGSPEIMSHFKITGIECWSRRITKKDRLVYYVRPPYFKIVSCRYHYKRN